MLRCGTTAICNSPPAHDTHHNRCDFEQLHEAALRDQRLHAGILIASRRASDFELARRIMTVIDTFTAEEVTNQLLYL
jgi:hypothetical protein